MRQHNPTLKSTILDDLTAARKMMTTTEMMELLRTSRNTLCAWCRAGKVPHTRMPDGSYLFDPGVITAWLAERSIP